MSNKTYRYRNTGGKIEHVKFPGQRGDDYYVVHPKGTLTDATGYLQKLEAFTRIGEVAPPVVPDPLPVEPGEVDATDAARELAASHGIDLSRVRGSGESGRVLKADVETLIPTTPPPVVPLSTTD